MRKFISRLVIFLGGFLLGVGVVWGIVVWYNSEYFSCPTPIPIKNCSLQKPAIPITIAGEQYMAGVDTGSCFGFTFFPEELERLPVTQYGTTTYYDFKNNEYGQSRYVLSEMTVGDVELTCIQGHECDELYDENTTLWIGPAQEGNVLVIGDIGMRCFDHAKALFDFPGKKAWISHNLTSLKRKGYDFDKMYNVPLHPGNHLIVTAQANSKELICVVDTGATVNFIGPQTLEKIVEAEINLSLLPQGYGYPIYTFEQFVMNGVDYGQTSFYVLKELSLKHFDAVLGMDFLKNQVMYIDMENRQLCFKGKE